MSGSTDHDPSISPPDVEMSEAASFTSNGRDPLDVNPQTRSEISFDDESIFGDDAMSVDQDNGSPPRRSREGFGDFGDLTDDDLHSLLDQAPISMAPTAGRSGDVPDDDEFEALMAEAATTPTARAVPARATPSDVDAMVIDEMSPTPLIAEPAVRLSAARAELVQQVFETVTKRRATFDQDLLWEATSLVGRINNLKSKDIEALGKKAQESHQLTKLYNHREPAKELFTYAKLRENEFSILRIVRDLSEEEGFSIPDHVVEAFAQEHSLDAGDVEELKHLAGPARVVTFVGVPGSGKTTALSNYNKLVDYYNATVREEDRIKLTAAAPTHKAAGELADRGIRDSQTLHKFVKDRGGSNSPEDWALVHAIMDEFSMAATEQAVGAMNPLRAFQSSNRMYLPKAVIAGDPRQLGSVPPGGLLAPITEIVPPYEKTKSRRNKDPVRRNEVDRLSAGVRDNPRAAFETFLTALNGRQEIHTFEPSEDPGVTPTALARKISSLVEDQPDDQWLVIAQKNDTVNALNDYMHRHRKAAGRLGGESFTVNSKIVVSRTSADADRDEEQKQDKRIDLREGTRLFFNGQVGVFSKKNGPDRFKKIKKATLATVVSLEAKSSKDFKGKEIKDSVRVGIRVDGTADIVYFDTARAQDFTYGYAVTVNQSQGASIEHPIVTFENDTPWNHAFTAVTRDVDKNDIVISRAFASNVSELSGRISKPDYLNNSVSYETADDHQIRRDWESRANALEQRSRGQTSMDRESAERQLETDILQQEAKRAEAVYVPREVVAREKAFETDLLVQIDKTRLPREEDRLLREVAAYRDVGAEARQQVVDRAQAWFEREDLRRANLPAPAPEEQARRDGFKFAVTEAFQRGRDEARVSQAVDALQTVTDVDVHATVIAGVRQWIDAESQRLNGSAWPPAQERGQRSQFEAAIVDRLKAGEQIRREAQEAALYLRLAEAQSSPNSPPNLALITQTEQWVRSEAQARASFDWLPDEEQARRQGIETQTASSRDQMIAAEQGERLNREAVYTAAIQQAQAAVTTSPDAAEHLDLASGIEAWARTEREQRNGSDWLSQPERDRRQQFETSAADASASAHAETKRQVGEREVRQQQIAAQAQYDADNEDLLVRGLSRLNLGPDVDNTAPTTSVGPERDQGTFFGVTFADPSVQEQTSEVASRPETGEALALISGLNDPANRTVAPPAEVRMPRQHIAREPVEAQPSAQGETIMADEQQAEEPESSDTRRGDATGAASPSPRQPSRNPEAPDYSDFDDDLDALAAMEEEFNRGRQATLGEPEHTAPTVTPVAQTPERDEFGEFDDREMDAALRGLDLSATTAPDEARAATAATPPNPLEEKVAWRSLPAGAEATSVRAGVSAIELATRAAAKEGRGDVPATLAHAGETDANVPQTKVLEALRDGRHGDAVAALREAGLLRHTRNQVGAAATIALNYNHAADSNDGKVRAVLVAPDQIEAINARIRSSSTRFKSEARTFDTWKGKTTVQIGDDVRFTSDVPGSRIKAGDVGRVTAFQQDRTTVQFADKTHSFTGATEQHTGLKGYEVVPIVRSVDSAGADRPAEVFVLHDSKTVTSHATLQALSRAVEKTHVFTAAPDAEAFTKQIQAPSNQREPDYAALLRENAQSRKGQNARQDSAAKEIAKKPTATVQAVKSAAAPASRETEASNVQTRVLEALRDGRHGDATGVLKEAGLVRHVRGKAEVTVETIAFTYNRAADSNDGKSRTVLVPPGDIQAVDAKIRSRSQRFKGEPRSFQTWSGTATVQVGDDIRYTSNVPYSPMKKGDIARVVSIQQNRVETRSPKANYAFTGAVGQGRGLKGYEVVPIVRSVDSPGVDRPDEVIVLHKAETDPSAVRGALSLAREKTHVFTSAPDAEAFAKQIQAPSNQREPDYAARHRENEQYRGRQSTKQAAAAGKSPPEQSTTVVSSDTVRQERSNQEDVGRRNNVVRLRTLSPALANSQTATSQEKVAEPEIVGVRASVTRIGGQKAPLANKDSVIAGRNLNNRDGEREEVRPIRR